jgi:DivIVA domain-containing protein
MAPSPVTTDIRRLPSSRRRTEGADLRQDSDMPLSPEDVSSKRFKTVRFKEGYEETEVDAFLDEVVEELRRLNARIAELEGRI